MRAMREVRGEGRASDLDLRGASATPRLLSSSVRARPASPAHAHLRHVPPPSPSHVMRSRPLVPRQDHNPARNARFRPPRRGTSGNDHDPRPAARELSGVSGGLGGAGGRQRGRQAARAAGGAARIAGGGRRGTDSGRRHGMWGSARGPGWLGRRGSHRGAGVVEGALGESRREGWSWRGG
jgi:hypothetical protein